VNRTVWMIAALALASGAGAAGISEPCAARSGPQAPDDPRLREWLRTLVHEVARQEGVDPYALEALGMTETTLRPWLGRSCEVGARTQRPQDSDALLGDGAGIADAEYLLAPALAEAGAKYALAEALTSGGPPG